tara:strand:- start:91 stop:351 length:261 start_codon:yes stop_codon:yes gene_type:complete
MGPFDMNKDIISIPTTGNGVAPTQNESKASSIIGKVGDLFKNISSTTGNLSKGINFGIKTDVGVDKKSMMQLLIGGILLIVIAKKL